MNETNSSGNGLPSWQFHLEKLGSLESGDMEIKPLTLLCGLNNTGKTWAMYALYGFLDNAIGNGDTPPLLPNIDIIAKHLRSEKSIEWDFGGWVEQYANQLVDLVNKGTNSRLADVFNASGTLFLESRFDWKIDPEIFISLCIQSKMEFGLSIDGHSACRFFKPENARNLQITLNTVEKLPDLELNLSMVILAHLLRTQKILFGSNMPSESWVFLIPAERNGLHLFRKELVARRVAFFHHAAKPNFNLAELLQETTSRYAKPIADYIDWLNNIPALHRKEGGMHELAEQVIAIAEGKYEVDSDGNVLFAPKAKSRKKLPKLDFHLASSTAKSLFGLWFYLEYEAKLGDTLMIDEPELNLHPDNQRKFARLLVRLVNAGIRVVASTHSDYIVREINNLIMLRDPFKNRNALVKKDR
ncbi:MAG: AAA family ATPase, partial [Candidatus Methylumidiphilus sp.]